MYLYYEPCFVLLHSRATVIMRRVRRPSVKIIFLEIMNQINAQFGGKVCTICTLSPEHFFFLNFKCLNIYNFSVKMGPYGSKRHL